MHGATFVTDLAMVLGVAALTSVLARLLRQPTILGYLIAGLIVGPYIPIPLFADAERVQALAEFGVILVMFAIGLEFRIAKFLRVLPFAGLTGLVQISFLLWCGFSLGRLLGWGTVESLFLGTGIAISSTMVVSRVFDQRPVSEDIRQFVLGVLIIQDVVAIALIAAMTAVAAGGGLAQEELAAVVGQLGVVLIAMLGLGLLVFPRVVRAVARLESSEILVVVSVGLCFGTALLAEKFGYSVALGAFIAGLLVSESGRGGDVERLIEPLRDIFAATFFVSIGMTVDPSEVWSNLPISLVVFAVVVLAQLLSVSLAGIISGHGLRRAMMSGLSLRQIGEFGFILAAIGISAGAAPGSLQPILVTVAVLTAFTTSLLLGMGDRIVRQTDRLLPKRLQHLLSLYEDWLERFRGRPAEVRVGKPVHRALRALAFDAVAITGLLAISLLWRPRASQWLVESLNLPVREARWGIELALVLLLLPFLYALFRNTLSLSRLVGDSILARSAAGSSAAGIAVRTLRGMVTLGVLIGVGAPMTALLRPLTGGFYGAALLAGLGAALVVFLWRSAGAMEREFQSGAEQIAEMLARQSGQEEPESLNDPTLLPGLDSVVQVRIPPSAQSIGKSLSQLEVRARTGATVLAIQRGEAKLLLPTGRESLQPGDTLAVIGTGDSIARARQMLTEAAPPESA